jgi:hypothetical protein
MAQSIIAGFVMSLLLLVMGFFAMRPVGLSDTRVFVAVMGLVAGLLGIDICAILWNVSARLTRIEKR